MRSGCEMDRNETRALWGHRRIVRRNQMPGLKAREESDVRDHGRARVAGRPGGWAEKSRPCAIEKASLACL
jgi:hypothetical protein